MGDFIRMNTSTSAVQMERPSFVFIGTKGPSWNKDDSERKAMAIIYLFRHNMARNLFKQIEQMISTPGFEEYFANNRSLFEDAYDSFIVGSDNS